ncbi:transcriptional regulator [Pseudomonas fragi]|uniref:Transcriptional regulator n=1 Tax=Pseudomonas fragi TaxID=296 RepID=A0A266LSN2_PSEFR|nr:XRE family transcriptional regulator [Pseudomonas fragi]OZY41066.1 transcriptional regulator [Pseudomonas fragi]
MNIPTGFLDSSGSVPFSLPERDQQGDDPIAERISHNVRRLRDKRQLSLETLAHASGVRRALIAQIEAGRSLPSVKVLSKIAGALKVSIAELLDPDSIGIVIRRALPPEHATHGVTFSELRLAPQAEEQVPGNPHNVQKNLQVAKGSLELSIDDQQFVLNVGDSILFRGEQPHRYRNPHNSEAVAYLLTSPAQVQE